MRNQRSFSPEFKRQVVEELLSGESRPAQPGGFGEGKTGEIELAVARTTLDPRGTVFIHEERWEAILDEGRVEPGEEVVITKVEGLKLMVTKKKEEGGKG